MVLQALPDFRTIMLVYEYGSKDFESQIASAIQAEQPFVVEVKGWRKRAIETGLQHYLRYLHSRLRGENKSISALRMIPFSFVTPTFWIVCVKAEAVCMYPRILEQSADVLAIKFEAKKIEFDQPA